MSHTPRAALLADIGRNECRLALMDERRDGRPSFSQNAQLASADFPSLADLLRHYIDLIGQQKLPKVLALSLAHPVTQDVIALPAPSWTIDKRRLEEEFGFSEVVFVNDTSALASSLLWLGQTDARPIGACPAFKAPAGSGRYAVMHLSFGLGVAALVGKDDEFSVVDSEGGHSGYAPQTQDEIAVLAEMMKTTPHISNEMLLAMDGISRIYAALCAVNGEFDAKLSPLEIILYGKTGAEENCAKALSLYFDMAAATAGDTALNLCAVDGLFLCGEAITAIADILPHERFREVFQRKGSFSEFVGRIPTYVIANPNARLIGLSRLICEGWESERRSREKRAAPDALLSEITSAIDQAIMIVDSDLNIIACTRQSWYNLPGAGDLAGPGKPVEAYIRALADAGQFGLSQSGETAERIIARFRAGAPFEYARTTFGGRCLLARAEPRHGGGFIVIETDHTERNTKTKELESLAANLREAKIRSDEASRAKSEFLANMSHEIRTPLNGVLGMADVLSKTMLNPSQSEMIDVIIKSGNGLLTVINDILDFSKLEAGKLRLQTAPFDLRSTIEDVATMFAPQVETKNVELMVRVAPEAPVGLIGDAGRLRQILTNIVGNAVKFTDKGHILIDVRGRAARGRAELDIAIQDTGCGVPADKLDRIFDMFEQADGSSTRSHQGTGLGLTITRRIVEAMNGAVRAESKVGEGSTFRIALSLPLCDAEGAVAEPQDFDAEDLKGARVLIVDDQHVNRQILCEQTQSWGMAPLLAASGAEALETLRREKEAGRAIDVAILDYQMPGMHGLELAEKIKADPALSSLPLILLTSVGHVGDTDARVDENFVGYLVKPARAVHLLENIGRALARGGSSPKSSRPAAKPRSETPAPAPAPDGKRMKIFVVEDNPVNRQVISSMLKNPGYELIELDDGEKAVSEYMNALPDLILMDVSMPNLDGYAATRRIRELEQQNGTKAAPIIGVTAHAMPEDRAKCMDSGMNDYLPKPIRQNALEEVIRRHCA